MRARNHNLNQFRSQVAYETARQLVGIIQNPDPTYEMNRSINSQYIEEVD